MRSENTKKQCYFCTTNRPIDYKDADTLKRFISAGSKIYSRRKSFLCAYHQRELAGAIKRARYLSLVPYTSR